MKIVTNWLRDLLTAQTLRVSGTELPGRSLSEIDALAPAICARLKKQQSMKPWKKKRHGRRAHG